MDTHYNPNRKIYKSDFLDPIAQRDYLEEQRSYTTGKLVYQLKGFHNTITDTLSRKINANANEEDRSYVLRQLYESVQDIATILKERDELPIEFEPFVLNIDDLPWNRYRAADPHTSRSVLPRS